MTYTHYSKIDWWVYGIMCLVSFFTLIYPLVAYITQTPETPLWIAVLYLTIFVTLLLITWPVRYELTDNFLVIKSGLISWKISLDSILSVENSRSAWSSPALSLDRLKNLYSQTNAISCVCISPRDKQAFLNDLLSISDNLKRAENGLVQIQADKV